VGNFLFHAEAQRRREQRSREEGKRVMEFRGFL